MIFRGSRTLTRLPQWGTLCVESRSIALLALNLERALPLTTGLKSCNGKLEESCSFATPSTIRTYATKPVSRPKAHTGRTASASRKKTATGSKAKPAKRATRKATSKKGKSKAKPRTRARSTNARTKAKTKAKPKPKRKVLTDEQKAALKKRKEATQLKLLKTTALKPPKALPGTAWSVYLAESVKSNKGPIGTRAKEASSKYKGLAPGQREVCDYQYGSDLIILISTQSYNHTANQNKAANASQYQKWILSFTPSQIYDANNARSQLRRQTTKAWYKLHDERLVKRQKSAYNLFHSQRYSSGDFQGLKVTEAAKLIGDEWKGLSTNEKKACDLPSPYSLSSDANSYTGSLTKIWRPRMQPDMSKKSSPYMIAI
ncbi:MAG: hypothetical protein LQ342_002289 [Letrouitia transgressa]|nr:MAG: hypothetical protein LQ342_002289 [Letrouitia transgressa]